MVATPPFAVPPPRDDLLLALSCTSEAPPARPSVIAVVESSGPAGGGTEVDVLGTGFTNTTTILFGGQPATHTTVLAPTVTGLSPNAGPPAGGTEVRVQGTGFAGEDEVMFGSTSASSASAATRNSSRSHRPAAASSM
jgi:large repetitive protein